MSGTSMDAIDAAVVEIDAAGSSLGVELRTFVEVPYPQATREALEHVLSGVASGAAASLAELASLNMAIGEAFAHAADIATKEHGCPVDLIGSHGQTVSHVARPKVPSGLLPATLQLGEPAVIAAQTGVTCVADFRVADVAAGGQGAPLVSYIDYLLLRSAKEFRVALNIGGIANVTLLPPGATPLDVSAFDSGPGNMPLDVTVRLLFPDGPGFDRNGQIAARGSVNETLLAWLMEDPYFSLPAPKTAGREQFGPGFVERAWQRAVGLGCTSDDVIATLTELTAKTIAVSIPSQCQRVIASGGGVHNKTLMRSLARDLAARPAPPELVTSDAHGLPPDAKEAIAFAALAVAALQGKPSNLPQATGAHQGMVLGKIVPGANFSSLMRSIWG
jgi:anhydro-N-acetylmuramic acid kinase